MGKEGSWGRSKTEGGDDLPGDLCNLEVSGSLGLTLFNIVNKIITLFQGSHAEPQKSVPRILIRCMAKDMNMLQEKTKNFRNLLIVIRAVKVINFLKSNLERIQGISRLMRSPGYDLTLPIHTGTADKARLGNQIGSRVETSIANVDLTSIHITDIAPITATSNNIPASSALDRHNSYFSV